MGKSIESMFSSLKQPRDISKYQLMRGVTDFSNLAQWNMYETGYAFLKIVRMPKVLEALAESNTEYRNLIDTYKKIIEFEFKSMSNLPDLTTESLDVTNNISSISLIGKSVFESNISFSMPYFERSGTPLTKVHELWIRAIKDPRTTFKHYCGLLENGTISDPGFEYETATFLYGVTDNTGLKLERSFLIVGVQPESANLSELYEYTKGTIENKELSLSYKGFVMTGREIDKRAKIVLDDLNNPGSENYIVKDETEFMYTQTEDIK